MLAPLIALLHLQGVAIQPYLDDSLVSSPFFLQTSLHVENVLHILTSHGFLVNVKKSHLLPLQDHVFIGAWFRTDQGLVTLPERRVLSIQSHIRDPLVQGCQLG